MSWTVVVRAPISQRLRLMVVGGVSSHLMYLNCAALVLFTDIHVDDDAGSRKIISLPAYVRNVCVVGPSSSHCNDRRRPLPLHRRASSLTLSWSSFGLAYFGGINPTQVSKYLVYHHDLLLLWW